jgi:hypothetical protein
VFSGQKEARNIEHGFSLGHKNVHFIREDIEQHEQVQSSPKHEALAEFKKAIEVEGDFKKMAIDPRVLDRGIFLGTEMSPQEQVELLQFLDKNSDVFTWSTYDLVGVSRGNQTQAASQSKHEDHKAEAPQNVRGKGRSSEG